MARQEKKSYTQVGYVPSPKRNHPAPEYFPNSRGWTFNQRGMEFSSPEKLVSLSWLYLYETLL